MLLIYTTVDVDMLFLITVGYSTYFVCVKLLYTFGCDLSNFMVIKLPRCCKINGRCSISSQIFLMGKSYVSLVSLLKVEYHNCAVLIKFVLIQKRTLAKHHSVPATELCL